MSRVNARASASVSSRFGRPGVVDRGTQRGLGDGRPFAIDQEVGQSGDRRCAGGGVLVVRKRDQQPDTLAATYPGGEAGRARTIRGQQRVQPLCNDVVIDRSERARDLGGETDRVSSVLEVERRRASDLANRV